MWPIKGSNRCRIHGGSAPQTRAKAARRLAEGRIRKAIDKVEVREVVDPIGELMRLAGEVVTWKDVMASHVAFLREDYRYDGDRAGEQLRAEVALYERAIDRTDKVLSNIAKLNLEERLVHVSELQAAKVASIIKRAVDVAVDQGKGPAYKYAAKELRELSGRE